VTHTEPDNEALGINPVTGWRLLAVWIALGVAAWACSIATGYVAWMIYQLVRDSI
jgi:F0F1-type ATP synthase membrane subunit c/vacuolar-type H+-ATPase subunit K